jgi:hypothetical protein
MKMCFGQNSIFAALWTWQYAMIHANHTASVVKLHCYGNAGERVAGTARVPGESGPTESAPEMSILSGKFPHKELSNH